MDCYSITLASCECVKQVQFTHTVISALYDSNNICTHLKVLAPGPKGLNVANHKLVAGGKVMEESLNEMVTKTLYYCYRIVHVLLINILRFPEEKST